MDLFSFFFETEHILAMLVCVGLGVVLHAFISLLMTRSQLHKEVEQIQNPIQLEHNENTPGNGNLKRIKDLTEMLEKSESIYERKDALLNSLLDAHGSAVIVCSPAHEVVHFNKAAEEVLGYTSDEILGRNFFEVFYSDSNCSAKERFWEAATADSVAAYDSWVTVKGGIQKNFSWVARAFYGDDNQLLYIFKIGREVVTPTSIEPTPNTGESDGTTTRKRKRVGRVQKNGSQRTRKSGSRSRRRS